MEIVIAIVVIGAIVLFFGQMSLDKPVASWSDEELVRRLPKYQNVLSTQMQAGQWDKTSVTTAKMDEIKAEIVKREMAHQAKKVAPLKQESLFSDKSGSVITEKAIQAAEAGDVDLQVLVGSAYLTGANGLPQNPHKAALHLLKAAEQGHAFAAFVVAGLYSDGIGLELDFDKARQWAVRAKSLGAPDAEQMLAAIDAKRSA